MSKTINQFEDEEPEETEEERFEEEEDVLEVLDRAGAHGCSDNYPFGGMCDRYDIEREKQLL